MNNNYFRIAGFVTGILLLALTLGFVFQLPWVVNLWPWPESRLSYLFLGSILAAITVAVGWFSLLGEWGALPAGALNVFVIAVTWAVYFLQRSFSDHRSSLLYYGIVGILIAFVSGLHFFGAVASLCTTHALLPVFFSSHLVCSQSYLFWQRER